jgi:hypothetical protein
VKARKERTRRLKVGVGLLTTDCKWRDPTLTISSYRNGKDTHEVVIEIQDPWEVRVLQRELSKILAYWQEQLK